MNAPSKFSATAGFDRNRGAATSSRQTRSATAVSMAVLSLLSVMLVLPAAALATTVRVETNVGPIDIQLFDQQAPATVANFLTYVRSGAYDSSFFHRSVEGFVIQGGGYTWRTTAGPLKIPALAPVVNEFSPTRSNLRGTVAMAKLGNNPNSATTEWFVNLANNSANLDNQNGGFTVFGRITPPGMLVVDQIAALSVVNFSGCESSYSALNAVPVVSTPISCALTTLRSLTFTPTVRVLSEATATDRVFNYLEAVYPQYLRPSTPSPTLFDPGLGYFYRYYPDSNAYIGVKDGQLDYWVPELNPNIQRFGPFAEQLTAATAAGY